VLPLLLEPEWLVDERGHALDGPVRIESGRIVAIGTHAERAGAVVIPLPGRIVCPGFVNAHSHAFQRGIRGVVENKHESHAHDDFWTWRTRMYALATALSADEMRAVARAAYLEMLRAGYTSVGEFHYIHRASTDGDTCAAVAAAARDTGIRLTLLETGYARAGPGKTALPAQRRFVFDGVERFLEHAMATATAVAVDDQVRVGLAIHSVRACPLDWIETIAARARSLAWPLHVHASEQQGELAVAMAEHGRSPIAILDDAGALTPLATVVHATHVSAFDVERLARAGATVCLCPTTERNLGDGICPTRDFVDAGIPLAIGSDSQTRIDPLLELAAVEEDERLRLMARSVLVEPGASLAHALMPMGTLAGARALASDVGRLAVGAPADLVSLALPALIDVSSRADALDAILVAGTRADVHDVFIAGVPVVLHQRCVTLDAARIERDAHDALRAARARELETRAGH
jgi:formimidoylglutamate deiminase